jgi:endonuclease-3 related protein
MSLYKYYQQLYQYYGSQQWWPAESPFEVMVGAILTQNTSWSGVEKAITNLKTHQVLNPDAVAALSHQDLGSLIRPSGFFNQKAQRLHRLVTWLRQMGDLDGLSTMETTDIRLSLLAINGVGPETADDILLYALERPVFVIDAYTRRIFSRLGQVDARADYDTLQRTFEQALAQKTDRLKLFKDYHALIVIHAKTHCRVKPLCHDCPLASDCTFFIKSEQ